MDKSKEEILIEIIAEMKLEDKSLHLSKEDIIKLYEYLIDNNKEHIVNNKFKGNSHESK